MPATVLFNDFAKKYAAEIDVMIMMNDTNIIWIARYSNCMSLRFISVMNVAKITREGSKTDMIEMRILLNIVRGL